MKILIFGATGFIGKALTSYLYEKNYDLAIVSRNAIKARKIFPASIEVINWDFADIHNLTEIISQFEVIINLAGENIASKLWTQKQKQKILTSRVQLGNQISDAIAKAQNKPALLVQASAIGYYGYHTEHICTERSPKGAGFLAQLCDDWENSTQNITTFGVKRIVVRTGIVLGLEGGILPQLIKTIKYYLGAQLGKGNNWISWIHIQDEVRAIEFLIQNQELSGIYNLTSPHAIQAWQLNTLLGRNLKRPVWIKIPAVFIKLFLGTMAKELVLASQKVSPERLLKLNFEFTFSEASSAIESLLNKKTA